MLLIWAPQYYFIGRYLISKIDLTHCWFLALSDIGTGKILLGVKCPFVQKKKLSGHKNCPDKKIALQKKIVWTKKLSLQKNCPIKKIVRTKKLSRQKNCPDKKIVPQKKIVWTKKLSLQKNCTIKKIVWTKKLSRQFFFVCVSNALFLFFVCSSSSGSFVLSIFWSYFYPIVQQAWYLFQKHFYNFLGILWALVITTCLTKLLTKLTNIPLKLLSPKVWEILFWR